MNIDMHCHLFVDEYVELLRSRRRLGSARLEQAGGTRRIVYDDGRAAALDSAACDPAELVRWLDDARIDHAVLSPPPMTLHADLPEADARLVAETLNRGLSEVAVAFPDRLAFFACVPMQHPRLAVEMLDAVANASGAVGIEIPAVIEGHDLDDPGAFTVLSRARDLGLVVFVHPGRPRTSGVFARYSLANALANPLETTIAAAALAFGGVLERLPGLKVVLCHGAGALPYLRGRMRRGYEVTRAQQRAKETPDSAFASLYADTLTHDDAALAFLVRVQGADRLVLGSDHPFALGDARPVDAIERVVSLSSAERALICGGNAARLLGRWG